MAVKKTDEEVSTEQKQQAATTEAHGPNAKEQPEQPTLVRAVFITNAKHDRTRYHAGQKVELPEDVYEVLLQAKAIRPVEEW